MHEHKEEKMKKKILIGSLVQFILATIIAILALFVHPGADDAMRMFLISSILGMSGITTGAIGAFFPKEE